MKKALACAVVLGLIAMPLSAAPIVQLGPGATSAQQLLGSPSNPGGMAGSRTTGGYVNGTETVYDNMAGAFGVTGSTPFTVTASVGAPTMIMDDIHINSSLASASIGGMHWLYYNPGAPGTVLTTSLGGTSGVTADTIAFFTNPGGANTAVGATIAAFGITAPTGFFLFTLNFAGSGLVLPKDSWVGFRKNGAFTVYTGGAPGPAAFGSASSAIGLGFGTFPTPGITSAAVLPIISVGSFTTTGTPTSPGLPGGPQTGSLHIAFDNLPEPAAIALLSLGGLVALRRRRVA